MHSKLIMLPEPFSKLHFDSRLITPELVRNVTTKMTEVKQEMPLAKLSMGQPPYRPWQWASHMLVPLERDLHSFLIGLHWEGIYISHVFSQIEFCRARYPFFQSWGVRCDRCRPSLLFLKLEYWGIPTATILFQLVEQCGRSPSRWSMDGRTVNWRT